MKTAIPFVDFGGTGDIIHFAHANGFPVKSYQKLLQELTQNHHVIGMNARPLWKNADHNTFNSWYQAANDLIQFLDEKGFSNSIGIGHSFGSIITIIAANKRPDLFSKLVLIEPVILPTWVYLMTAALPNPILKRVSPIIKKTLVRTEKWQDREMVFAQFRCKKVFSRMADDVLWDYVNAVTTETKTNEVVLSYSKEWEAQLFLTVPNPWKELKRIKHPFLALRGENSDTLVKDVWNKWKAKDSSGKFLEIPATGHLVPLEEPQIVAKEILGFLEL